MVFNSSEIDKKIELLQSQLDDFKLQQKQVED